MTAGARHPPLEQRCGAHVCGPDVTDRHPDWRAGLCFSGGEPSGQLFLVLAGGLIALDERSLRGFRSSSSPGSSSSRCTAGPLALSWADAGAGADIARSAFDEASRSNRSEGSLTLMPPLTSSAVDRSAALLDDVGQLVGEHRLALRRTRVVLVPLKHHIRPDGVSVGVDRLGGFVRPRIVVHPDITEIVAEPALHLFPHVGGQRAASAGVDHIMDR